MIDEELVSWNRVLNKGGMRLPRHIIIPKSTGTITDLLIAFGAAEILRQIVKQHVPAAQVILSDNGAYFVADASIEIEPDWVTKTVPFEPILFLSSAKMPPPADLPKIGTRN